MPTLFTWRPNSPDLLPFTPRAWTEVSQPFPGVDSRGMAVRPNNLDRVVAYQLHICNDDVLRDRGRIKSSDTGPFINTIGTGTLPAKVPVWIDPHMAFFPGNLEIFFFLEPSYVFGRRIHDPDPFGSILSLSVAIKVAAQQGR
jgi:hypothetical protein